MFLENCETVFVKKIDFHERINLTEEVNDSLLTNCEEVSKELNNANPVKISISQIMKIVFLWQKTLIILL